MDLKVVFELDDSDLKHFRLIMDQASEAAARARPEDIVAAAEDLVHRIGDAQVPRFIQTRLDSLKDLIRMLKDVEWGLPEDDARRVLNVLAYFCEPEDLIPDTMPGLGYLDDAIMIELAVRELEPEIAAYRDFCEFRESEITRRGVKVKTTDITRDDWLADRREKFRNEKNEESDRFQLF